MYDEFKVSILIPVYNSPDRIKSLINSIVSCNEFNKIHEIIIGNDASDATTSLLLSSLAQSCDKIHIVNRKNNLGYLRNVNDLYTRSAGDIVVLLNSDTLVPQRWIERIVECFVKNPTVALATPLSTNASFVTVLPAPGQSWKDVDLIVASIGPSYPDIPSAIGFCLAIRRSSVDRSELLNTAYKKGYWEDTELHYYMLQRQFRSVCIDNLLVYHASGSSSFSLSYVLSELNDQNRATFMAAYGKKYLAATAQFENKDPLAHLRPNENLRTSISRISDMEFIFVLPAIVRESGGIYVVLRLVECLLARGVRASIYCFGHVDWAYVRELGFFYPFTNVDEILKTTSHVANVFATSYDSFSHALALRNRFSAKLCYLIQGPESAFANGNGVGVVAGDYKRADKVIAVSPFLQRYVGSLSQVEASLIRMGPQKELFYPDENGRRDIMAIAVAVRQGPLKGTGHALHNAKLAKNAGFRLHFFGDDLPASTKSLGKHHGRLGTREVARLMRSVGYYLDCSCMEGLGLLPLEAAFSGAIPILLQPNGLNHLVKDGDNCFILPTDFENDEFFRQIHATAQRSGHQLIRQSALSLSEKANESLAHDDFISLFSEGPDHFSEAGPICTRGVNTTLEALLDSTSWRATRRLRQFTGLLMGRRYREVSIPTSPDDQSALLVTILSSSSWAITLPLRKAGFLIRRLKKMSNSV